MERDDSKSVRLLETLPGPGIQQCLRLALCGAQLSEAMPGQYCLLANRSERWACSYVSLPGGDGRFMVATHSAHPLGHPGELLGYSGPLGSAWPVPLQSARLLAITRGEGVLALLCMLDEIHCWLPWVQVRLLHDGLPLEHLPTECRPMLRGQTTAPRNCLSGWMQLTHQLQAFRPDTVYCCAPAQIARQAARICWQKGVAPQRIWLRTDHMPRPNSVDQCSLGGPVQRYNRVLAALNWVPPPG
ncbi:hypothetical protein JYG34_13175 [Pseudomonas entomophila]|uniref:hypothetical protein n=1 Tax=Pseudomonas entomophila TaxID=312306 RepID=UPI001BCD4A34|nr:hypothetical protein [Pseudomonas entomophila]QVM93894.1 hypothetical protein JYG34_13175 [Pseudomonas entomophila]